MKTASLGDSYLLENAAHRISTLAENNCILVYMKAVMLVESVLYFSFPSSHTNSSSINSGAPEEIKRGMQEKICVQFIQLLNHRDQLFFCKRNSSTEEETVTEMGKSNKVK